MGGVRGEILDSIPGSDRVRRILDKMEAEDKIEAERREREEAEKSEKYKKMLARKFKNKGAKV